MPKQTDFHYYFRLMNPNWLKVTKIDPITGDVVRDKDGYENSYDVKGNLLDTGGMACTCMGYQRGAYDKRAEHKHLVWANRWAKIQKANPGMGPIYYDTQSDRFYPIAGLETNMLEALMEGAT